MYEAKIVDHTIVTLTYFRAKKLNHGNSEYSMKEKAPKMVNCCSWFL